MLMIIITQLLQLIYFCINTLSHARHITKSGNPGDQGAGQ